MKKNIKIPLNLKYVREDHEAQHTCFSHEHTNTHVTMSCRVGPAYSYLPLTMRPKAAEVVCTWRPASSSYITAKTKQLLLLRWI